MKVGFWMIVAGYSVATPIPVRAQNDVSANVAVVSDYRFRGISLSDRRPALQGGLDIETAGGFFAGVWGSTIAEYEGAKTEIDLYGGYGLSAGGFDAGAGAYFYLYPGGDVSYAEFQGTISRSVGPVSVGAEISWVPQQDNAETANLYLGASGKIQLGMTGIEILARGGRENGFYDQKWDWELAAKYKAGRLTTTLSYIDARFGGSGLDGNAAGTVVLAFEGEF